MILVQPKRPVPRACDRCRYKEYKRDGSTSPSVGNKKGQHLMGDQAVQSACSTFASPSRLSAYQADFKRCDPTGYVRPPRSRGAFRSFKDIKTLRVLDRNAILSSHLATTGYTRKDIIHCCLSSKIGRSSGNIERIPAVLEQPETQKGTFPSF